MLLIFEVCDSNKDFHKFIAAQFPVRVVVNVVIFEVSRDKRTVYHGQAAIFVDNPRFFTELGKLKPSNVWVLITCHQVDVQFFEISVVLRKHVAYFFVVILVLADLLDFPVFFIVFNTFINRYRAVFYPWFKHTLVFNEDLIQEWGISHG